MQDRVADVLAQRAALDRGAGVGVAISVLLHGGLAGLVVYSALHAAPPRPATLVQIQFASMPAPMTPARPKAAVPAAPKIEEPKPVIAEPKPEPPTPEPPKKPEKNSVPFSPFGQSTKKGSEKPPAPTAPPAATSTTAEVPIGGQGIAGVEGGDFRDKFYESAMHKKIGFYWARPTVPPGTTVIIYIRIERDGRITESRVKTPSGNGTFDRAALSAVRSASPLNRLPNDFSGTYLGVDLVFR